jgi:membrane fusion protein (multidrug efflux system)
LTTGACDVGGPATAKDPRPRPVETTPVIVRPVEVTVDAVGSLTARQSVDLRVQEPGIVQKLRVDSKGRIATGDLLLQLDNRQATAQVKLARANVAEAQASLRKNRRAHERIGALQGEGVASEQTGDEALAGLEQAQAFLDVAKARLVVAEAKLAETAIIAPFPGHLGRWQVDEGAYVQTGEILNRLTDDSTLEVRFAIPERTAAALAVGQKIRLEVSSHPDRKFIGRLTFIEPEIDTQTRSAQAIGTFDNSDRLLRSGQFARVELVLTTRPAGRLVPVTAVRKAREKNYVFLVEKNQAVPREVVLGIRLGEWREILDGLKPGDTVVQNGHTTLALTEPTLIHVVTLEDTRP